MRNSAEMFQAYLRALNSLIFLRAIQLFVVKSVLFKEGTRA